MKNQGKMVVVLKDDKSGAYKDPGVVESLPDLIRTFLAAVQQSPQSPLAMFPGDFSVWQIAEWNPLSGALDVLFTKEFLFNVADLLNQHASKKGSVEDV